MYGDCDDPAVRDCYKPTDPLSDTPLIVVRIRVVVFEDGFQPGEDVYNALDIQNQIDQLNCDFAPSSVNPMDFDEAYLKLRAMCQGARLLRDKYSG